MLKVKDCRTRALTCHDFRGIAISPIACKVFEYCLLDRLKKFLASADNQFGFKKRVRCNHEYSAKTSENREPRYYRDFRIQHNSKKSGASQFVGCNVKQDELQCQQSSHSRNQPSQYV